MNAVKMLGGLPRYTLYRKIRNSVGVWAEWIPLTYRPGIQHGQLPEDTISALYLLASHFPARWAKIYDKISSKNMNAT